ncbi:MAG: prenyltransferase/squalene oxidase repeat-containing protein, partial [Planctomycetia bacterium]|nr:prenyltransferase/squalene oxidase repeat-containing protein [Planctomycetia bacterium]
MKRCRLLALAVLMSVMVLLPGTVAEAKVTDDDVRRAIEKAKEYLLSQQAENGSWSETAIVMCTLTYIGMHPNRPSIAKGLYFLVDKPETNVYRLSLKVMALSYVQNKLIGKRRQIIRKVLISEANALVGGQNATRGWRYSIGSSDLDFSCTQLAVLGLREAALAGVEIPRETFSKVQGLYYDSHNADGGWGYTPSNISSLNMTAAGLASIYITSDNLLAGLGCPYLNVKARAVEAENIKHLDAAMNWLVKKGIGGNHYGMYAVERVAITGGYKYFGKRDWYKQYAETLVKAQGADGSWTRNYGSII